MIIDTSKSPYAKVYSVAQENVDWDGGFWRERFDVAADSTVPHIRAMFEDKDPWFHVVENFRVAAGIAEGDHEGTPFGDGDFYKWLEAATYVVAKRRDKKLEEELDDYIELIGKCQQPDGYISTKQIIADRKRTDGDSSRLGDINDFECYNFGHLFTAACTYKRVTGKDAFLKIAIKAAGYLRTMYQGFLDAGEAKTEVCPSHYMGLVELYRTTGDKEFLEIAKMAVAVRDLVKDGSFDNQDATPLRSHKKIMGHCVRSTYLYAGVADLYAETGDEEYRAMLDRVWKNGFMQKTYLNGGNAALYTGNSPYGLFPYLNGAKVSFVHQAYGYEYQLPNITAYNETCGALGSIMWNLRMFSLDPKAKYFDLIERTMLNLTIASVSLDGDKYFYENMLRRTEELDYEVIWPRTRVNTMSCFCCPPNMARFITESSEYAYMQSDDAVWLGMYGESHLKAALANGAKFTLRQETKYPWCGKIRFRFEDVENNVPFTLKLRIPGWLRKGKVSVNGAVVAELDKKSAEGYFDVRVEDIANTVVELDMDLTPRLTIAHTKVEEDLNQVAVERGPLVYCVETMDSEAKDLGRIMIPVNAKFEESRMTIKGHELVTLETEGLTFEDDEWYDEDALYQTLDDTEVKPVKFRMIPYFAWDNRGMGEMIIWLPAFWGKY